MTWEQGNQVKAFPLWELQFSKSLANAFLGQPVRNTQYPENELLTENAHRPVPHSLILGALCIEVCCSHARHFTVKTQNQLSNPVQAPHPKSTLEKAKEKEDTISHLVATNKSQRFLDRSRTSPQWWASNTTVKEVTSQWSICLFKVECYYYSNKCWVCAPTKSPVTPLRKGWWWKYDETKRASDPQAQAWPNHAHRHDSSTYLKCNSPP